MVPRAFADQGFISSIGAAFFFFKCWNKIARFDTKLVNVLWDKKPPQLWVYLFYLIEIYTLTCAFPLSELCSNS